ncbi:SIR2 family protein [Cetobacterium sp.]|uniref:SIR2 family protein n=1 Tax=Cetobacterium sp. TaxID=2071632 RepID=UPI003F4073BD
MEFETYIENELSTENIPILFIGAGITKRYCIIDGETPPTWKELLKKIIAIYNKEEFYYDLLEEGIKREKHDIKSADIYQEIANIIEKEFNEATLKKELLDKEYEEKILEEYRKNRISPMKIFISIYFSKLEITSDPTLRKEIEKLKEIANKSLIIITTNYDLFLEKIFPEYKVIKGQELIKGRCVANILKVHGCVTDPKTIILSKNDYEEVANRKKVLNARMITFFAEHPVIFLGYSLDDINIQEFIDNIYTSFEKEEEVIKEISKKFLIVEWDKGNDNAKVEPAVIMKSFVIPIKRIQTDNYFKLFEGLKKLKININIKELALVEDVFLGAIKGNKKSNIKLINVGESTKENIDQEVILGFGVNVINMIYDANINYHQSIGYNKKDIYITPEDFINIYLPDLLKRSMLSLHPFFKYFSQCYKNIEYLNKKALQDIYNNFEKELERIRLIAIPEDYKNKTITEILEAPIGRSTKENYIKKMLLEDKISIQEIKEHIKQELIIRNDQLDTNLRKLIALIDYKEYSNAEQIEILEAL